MTDRLEQVIAKLQALPQSEQDLLADTILGLIDNLEETSPLSADQVAVVRSRLRSLQDGSTSLASDREMTELWAHCGL